MTGSETAGGPGGGLVSLLNQDVRDALGCLAQVPIAGALVSLLLVYGALYTAVGQVIAGPDALNLDVGRGLVINSTAD